MIHTINNALTNIVSTYIINFNVNKRQSKITIKIQSSNAPADIVDSLVVDHEGTVGVLQGRMRCEDRVVGLDHSGGHLGSGVDGELQFGLLAVVDAQPLHEQ